MEKGRFKGEGKLSVILAKDGGKSIFWLAAIFLPYHRLSGSSSGSARAFSIVAALSCFERESRWA